MRTATPYLIPAGAALAIAIVLQAAPQANANRQPAGQQTFGTPQEAAQAVIDAAEHNDAAALLKIFGASGKDIVESGDPTEDKNGRAEFARAAHEKLKIDQDA